MKRKVITVAFDIQSKRQRENAYQLAALKQNPKSLTSVEQSMLMSSIKKYGLPITGKKK